MPPARGRDKGEKLTFTGEFDGRGVSSGMKRMGTDWAKQMRKVEKASQTSFHGTGRHVAAFFKQQNKFELKHNKLLKEAVKEQTLYTKKVEEARKKALGMQAALKAAGGDKGKREQALKGIKEAKSDVKKYKKAQVKSRDAVQDIKESATFDKDSVRDAFFDAADEIKDVFSDALIEPFQSVLRKDAPGFIKGLTGGLGKAFKMGGNLLQGRLDASKAAGGGGGAMAGVLSKLAGTMKTLGPILTMVGGAIAAVVQLLLDAEAGAKEFNKQVLSTAGSSEFLHKNMMQSDIAAADLEGTLKKIRDQATSLDNMDWGINKETHTAVLNAITAEGVSLKKLDAQFEQVGKSAKDSAGYAKDWGSTVQMSVAYSRAFGVSLQEVGQLEGEMMTELGTNITGVEKDFQFMLQGAEEAGIATNKFFNIIRTFSADLTLFNIRMEDVTKTMIMLGKAMSPREAQKMLQSLNSMFKGKSLTDRTKDVIMAGAAGRKAMNEQQAGNVKSLAEDVGITPKEMKAILKKDTKQLAKWLATDGKNLNADQRRALFEAARMEHKLDTGDTIDLASAIKDANPWTAKKIADAKVASITGGKKIEQLTGINRIAAEQAADVGDELQDQIAKLEMSTASMKADLGEKLKDAHGDTSKFTKEEQKLLAKLGVKIDDGTTFDKLDAASSEDFYNSLDADQKDILANGKKEIDYQKEVAGLQTSALDKLGVLVDFVMNQIYDVMSNIYDSILDVLAAFHIIDANKRESQNFAKSIQKSGNKDLIAAWGKSHGDIQAFKGEVMKTLGAQFDKFFTNSTKEAKDLKEAIAKETDPKKKEALEKKLHELEAKRKGVVDKAFSKRSSDAQYAAIMAAANDPANKDNKGFQKLKDAAAKLAYLQRQSEKPGGGGIDPKALADAAAAQKAAMTALSSEDVDKLMHASIWSMTPEDLQKAAPDIGKALTEAAPNIDKATANLASPNSVHVDVNDPEQIGAGMMQDDNHEESQDAMDEQAGTLDNIYKALRVRGIKLDKPFLSGAIKTVLTDATYDAASDALYDYWVLTNTKGTQSWADWMKEGGLSGGAAMKAAGRWAKENPDELAKIYTGGAGGGGGGGGGGDPMTGNAAGGVVTAIRNGMAVVRPAAGEGMASVGKGETIGRAGGQVITLQLKGDLGRIIDAHADDRISHGRSMQGKR